jgi:hypothetical protein
MYTTLGLTCSATDAKASLRFWSEAAPAGSFGAAAETASCWADD